MGDDQGMGPVSFTPSVMPTSGFSSATVALLTGADSASASIPRSSAGAGEVSDNDDDTVSDDDDDDDMAGALAGAMPFDDEVMFGTLDDLQKRAAVSSGEDLDLKKTHLAPLPVIVGQTSPLLAAALGHRDLDGPRRAVRKRSTSTTGSAPTVQVANQGVAVARRVSADLSEEAEVQTGEP